MSELQTIIAPRAGMYAAPEQGSEMMNELLFGDNFQIIKTQGEWLKARALHDGYEGFVKAKMCAPLSKTSSHRIKVPLTHIYRKPDFKSELVSPLYFLSSLNLQEPEDNGFVQILQGHWVFAKHVMPIEEALPDHTETALTFSGSPYIWGGRSYSGLDCSGLVQLAVMSKGKLCPRDTKDQIKSLGVEVPRESLQRGDFVFFERHVGIMLDQDHVLNATARSMQVVIEPLKKLELAYNGLLQVRRLTY